MPEFRKDPKLYRELSIPFESAAIAEAAWEKFESELYELRKKHRIRDFAYVASFPVSFEDGEESDCSIVGHYGDGMKKASLFSYAAGASQAELEQVPNLSRAQGEKSVKGRR